MMLVVAVAAVCATAPQADASEAQPAALAEEVRAEATPAGPLPRHRLLLESLLAARLNPLGLQERLSLGYRYRLYDDPGALWRDAHLGVNLVAAVTPAGAAVGGAVTFSPLTILSMTAGYQAVAWFGTIDYLQSYPSATAAHSDSDLEAGTEAGENYATWGHELELSAQLLGKVGPVVLRDTLVVTRSDMKLHAGDHVYYDIRTDLLAPDESWALVNDTDLVYLTDWGLVAGLRFTLSHAFYEARHFAEGEPRDNPNTPAMRVGPLFAYVLTDELLGLRKPTLLVIVNWWLAHRYRTGADVSRWMPLTVIGLRFDSELASSAL